MKFKTLMGFAFGPIASAGIGLATVPVVAWAFNPDDVGRLNLLQVVLSFSLLLLVLGLDQAYVREFHETSDRARLLKTSFVPGFVLLWIGVLGTLAFGNELTTWMFGERSGWHYPVMLICILATYISRFLSLILRMQERGLAFSMSQVIPKILQLLLLGGVLFWGVPRDFSTLLWIVTASAFTVMLVYSWNTRQQWRPAFFAQMNLTETKALLRFGFPLIFSGLAYWGLTATSVLTLHSRSTLSELGIYSVTTSFASVATIFQSIFSVVWAPIVYKWVAEKADLTRLDVVTHQVLAAVCAMFVAVGLFSWLADYILPPHYAIVKYLVPCAIAPPLLYTLSEITCIGISITRRTVLTIWVTLVALLSNILLSSYLIPIYGAAGAVIANGVAFFVFFAARTEASALVWRQFSRLRLYLSIVPILGASLLTVGIGPAHGFYYILLWVVIALMVGWIFRTEWRGMFSIGREMLARRKVPSA